MEHTYTQIYNSKQRLRVTGNMITVTEKKIYFCEPFKKNFVMKKYVRLFANEEGYLCFKFDGDRSVGCFAITGTGKYRNCNFVMISKALQKLKLTPGEYNAEERDGYIVTDCKVNNN